MVLRPLVRWTAGSLGRWTAGSLGRWFAGSLVRWSAGPLVRWAAGPLGRWAAGPLGRWSARPLDRGALRTSEPADQRIPVNYTARMLPSFFDSTVELITRTSTDLPPDVRAAMRTALASEDAATRAGQAITIIAQNIDQAESCEGPICQDTGMPTFEVKVPIGANQIWMKQKI